MILSKLNREVRDLGFYENVFPGLSRNGKEAFSREGESQKLPQDRAGSPGGVSWSR